VADSVSLHRGILLCHLSLAAILLHVGELLSLVTFLGHWSLVMGELLPLVTFLGHGSSVIEVLWTVMPA